MRLDCIERRFSHIFQRYGRCVAKYPWIFVICSVIIAGSLASGFYRFSINTDVEYLYTPENGRAKTEKIIVVDTFGKNDSGEFDVLRQTTLGTYVKLIITASDGHSVLRQTIFDDILHVDDVITNITANNKKYNDVCAMWETKCAENNPLLVITQRQSAILNSINLTYPIHQFLLPGIPPRPPIYIPGIPLEKEMSIFMGSNLGGVDIDNNGVVRSVKAIQLVYYLRDDTNEEKNSSKSWITEVFKHLKSLSLDSINIAYLTSETLQEELVSTTLSIIPLFTITFSLLITFSITSCMMFDWVLSKPLFGFAGVLSAGLAVASSFGLLCHIGIQFIDIVASAPFLILAVGVDGMFVLLAAWRLTENTDDCEERIAKTFSEAAVSVTITSLTNGLAFGIGALTYYPSVRIFCLFTGVAILFNYLYTITFLGAILTLTGKREEQRRHCYAVCLKVTPKDNSDSRSTIYRLFCAGGFPSDPKTIIRTHSIMDFFKNRYGPFFMKSYMKALVLIVFAAYLGLAIFGCTQAEEGLQLKHLADDNSYAVKFYDLEDNYFKEYGPPLSVVITESIDLQAQNTVNETEMLLRKFEDNELFGDKTETISWTRLFFNYTKTYNLPTSIDTLTKQFLQEPAYKVLEKDIHFDNSRTKILASRSIIMTRKTVDSNRERDMMIKARQIADSSELKVTVYHPAFVFFDQYVTVVANTLQNIGIATGCMLVIALLLIPNPLCTVWVFFSIVSICTGVVGYMSWWGVRFDSIAMINVVMCIGFCVDFSAHITYAYSIATDVNPDDRVCSALGKLGYPIIQGAMSTIIGVVVLAFSTAYIFRSFFKIIFLVIIIATFHGLMLLPVLLALTGSQKTDNQQEQERRESTGSIAAQDGNSLPMNNATVYPVSGSQDTLVNPTMKNFIDKECKPSLYGSKSN